MNRLWLREYEILLSSNRRDDRVKKPVRSKVLSRPQTATSSRKVKQKKIIPAEELRNENELATELLAIATKGEYRRSAPELSERKFGTKKYSPSPNTTSPFRGLQTLEQFEEVERKKELYFQTHDVELFREIFPPVTKTNFRPTDRPRTSHGRRRGGGGGGGKDIVSRYDGLITPWSKEGNGDSIRRKSSPSRLNHATNVVQALLKSTNDQDRITAEDLQIDVTPIDKEIAQQAEGIWEQLVTEIWTCGQSILYNELTSFATSWQKSPTSRSIVRYLCALFGLKTHTSHLLVLAAERSLFRELLPLLKYLREINPLTVPRKRLLKARTIYDKYFVPLQEEHSLQVTDSESYLHITPLEQKFFRYVPPLPLLTTHSDDVDGCKHFTKSY